MDSKTYASTVGETRAAAHFTKKGWFVYNNSTGKGPVDLIILKDGNLKRVEVKTSSTNNPAGNPVVTLSKTRPNKNKNTTYKWSTYRDQVDLLFVYLFETDKCAIFDPQKISCEWSMTISKKRNERIEDI